MNSRLKPLPQLLVVDPGVAIARWGELPRCLFTISDPGIAAKAAPAFVVLIYWLGVSSA